MKILFASSSSGSQGGGEMYLVYLGRALAARGHEVTLWTSSHARMDAVAAAFEDFGRVARSGYRNTYDRPGRSLAAAFDGDAARAAAREWQALTPDVIHINKQNLEDGLDLLRAAALTATPHLCTIHLTQTARYLGAKLAFLRDGVARRSLARDRGIFITVLESRRAELAAFLGTDARVRTIENGVPLFDLTQRSAMRAAKRAALGLDERAVLVIGVGRLVAQKRPLLFLDIAEKTTRTMGDARFVWVGDGPLAGDFDRAVAERGLGEVVTRVGWQSDVAPFFAAADVLLHVAEFEGLPLALLEGMSAALPCAVTPNLRREMSFLEAAEPLPVEPHEAWIAALHDRPRLTQCGDAARRLVEERFSFTRMAAEHERLYVELTARP